MINALNEAGSATFDYSQRWRSSADVSMRMRAHARWLQEQAVASNLDNAAAYARTRDGWTQSIDQFLGRMGELAVMANDGTKSLVDRQALQTEFSQMQQAVQSITTGPDSCSTSSRASFQSFA